MQVLIILTDDRPCFRMDTEERPNPMEQARKQLKELKTRKVKVVTAAFGPYVNLRQLKYVNDGADVLHFQVEGKENFKFVGKDLLQSKCSKNIQTFFSITDSDPSSALSLNEQQMVR